MLTVRASHSTTQSPLQFSFSVIKRGLYSAKRFAGGHSLLKYPAYDSGKSQT